MAMMILGQFIFELRTVPYKTLTRSLDWRHSDTAVLGSRGTTQYVGVGKDEVKLDCTLYPELTGGVVSIDELRAMADTGAAYHLCEGSGRIYGQYIITGMEVTSDTFMDDGRSLHLEFSLSLRRVDTAASSNTAPATTNAGAANAV